MSRRLAALLTLCAGASGCAYRPYRVTPVQPAVAPEELVPPTQEPVRLVLQTVAGQHIDVADHRGVAVLILAFTTDNLASHAMVRSLERVARRHPDSLAVIAIAGDTGEPAALRTVLETYRDVAGLERTTLVYASDDLRAGTSVLGEIEHVPTLFFLNRAGVIVRRIEALLSDAQIETLIAPAIPRGR